MHVLKICPYANAPTYLFIYFYKFGILNAYHTVKCSKFEGNIFYFMLKSFRMRLKLKEHPSCLVQYSIYI